MRGIPHLTDILLTTKTNFDVTKVTRPFLKRILSYLKPYWPQFTAVFIATVASSVVGLLPSIYTGKIVDQALTGKDLGQLIFLLTVAIVAMCSSQLLGFIENYVNTWIAEHIVYDMRNEMYSHLQSMPHEFFTTERHGDVVTRMNSDIGGVSTVISGTLSKAMGNIVTVIVTLVALFSMSWQLAVVGIVVIPLLVVPAQKVGRFRQRLVRETQVKRDEMNQVVNETLSESGSLLMKMFTNESSEFDRFDDLNKEATRLKLRETRLGAFFNVGIGMFSQAGPLLLYFAGGMIMIEHVDPSLTVGVVTAMVTLVGRMYKPVENLLGIQMNFTRSLSMFDRIFDYLDRIPSITSPENAICPSLEDTTVTFDNVGFTYEGITPVLHDITFEIPSGHVYAIVGPSGAGKSTIVNLIPRLYDVTSGSVKVGGYDVRDFDLTYLRSQIGVVTQDTYLFNASIIDNLRYAKHDATLDEIERACKAASIHDFIVSQPAGYDTQVGNRGLKLSGGEKQRISIARVLLKDPKVLILDEATSSLDSISESAIQAALEKLMVGRTSIVIAHRLSTVRKADRVLVMKDGRLVEQGTHHDLLKARGVYSELYETQFRPTLENESDV